MGSQVVAQLTTATELAIAAEAAKAKTTLPPEYSKFSSVFSKEATDHVPPSRSYDHEINLNKLFIPKVRKLYPLPPEECKATKDFLNENLHTRKIHPSNSSQAASFFFVKKKDGRLCPCQDYRYLNEHAIRDAYPLSLISNLIDKLKDAQVFTEFNIH